MVYTMDEQIFQIHLILLSIIFPAIAAWFFRKFRCIDRLGKRSFRQSKALIELSRAIERQTNEAHPDVKSDVANMTERLLRDEEGNL